MPQLFVGTSGFSYSGWRGTFYPRRIKSTEMLAYYARQLGTVEVNTTFYRTQPDDVIAGWAASVPPAFRFAVKAHRRITHNRRMPNLEEAVRVLIEEADAFGDRLGPILFQLPPTASFDAGRIERIAALLPTRWRVAFQFRHRSWHTPEVAVLLERLGAALVYGDGEAEPGLLDRRLHLSPVEAGSLFPAASDGMGATDRWLPGWRSRRLRLFQARGAGPAVRPAAGVEGPNILSSRYPTSAIIAATQQRRP